LEKPAVLLVEDNEATVALITALLRHDFVVDPALDGGAAIEKLRTKYYAAILLDLRMPRTDGFAVLDFLKNNNDSMLRRVLIVTASLTRSDLERAAAYEVCGIVHKPFDVEALTAAVKECAGGGPVSFDRFLSGGMLVLLADMLQQRFML
jgi:CheY-like chemotaxis protein